jgi:hypothetical protein
LQTEGHEFVSCVKNLKNKTQRYNLPHGLQEHLASLKATEDITAVLISVKKYLLKEIKKTEGNS